MLVQLVFAFGLAAATVLVHALDQRLEEHPINESAVPEIFDALGQASARFPCGMYWKST